MDAIDYCGDGIEVQGLAVPVEDNELIIFNVQTTFMKSATSRYNLHLINIGN